MLAPRSYENRKICVLGLGRSGCASALALQEVGARVVGWDDDPQRRHQAADKGIAIAKDGLQAGIGVDVLLPAPGIPLTHPQPHPVVSQARAAGTRILGDVQLFQHVLDEQAQGADWIAITGTNGKSTTAALTAHMLRAAGRQVALGGNIGVPVMSLPPARDGLVYVLELSSFQIELAPCLLPRIAVQLNITADHLDRHASMEEYAAVKAGLFAHMGRRAGAAAIIGIDDAPGRALLARLQRNANIRLVALTMEGMPVPAHIENVRIDIDNESGNENDRLLDGIAGAGADNIHALGGASLMRGRHNRQNMAAAFAIGRLHGLPAAGIIESFAGFSPPPHRMQQVADMDGVLFINDSKATNAQSAARSLECFEHVHWILGGIPKADGIEPLRHLFSKVACAYLIGSAQEQFAAVLKKGGVPHHLCGDLRTATLAACKAALAAQTASVVLLAPACASFDQFADFEARGDAFCALIREFAQESGGDAA